MDIPTTARRPWPQLAVGGALAFAIGAAGCDRIVDRQIERNLSRTDTALLESPDMTVVLCGTGSPLPDRERAGACTAIVAGGQVFLVDVGPGSWETLDLADVPTSAVGAVFLTHFHSDHLGDLGEAITQSWIAGRREPLDVYGPDGVAAVVDGFQAAYAADARYRVAHHGESTLPAAGARAVAHAIALPDDPLGAVPVVDRAGVRVSAFRVDHQPVEPAVGYRFDYRGRSVVVSGDTRKSASLAKNAAGADLLVHEALQRDAIARVVAVAQRTGRTRLAKLAGDIPGYHTSPVEAAEVAREAGVKRLVLTHLVPGPNNFITRRMFLSGVSDAFPGDVVLGEDGMRFTLTPAS
ncbi:MAG TPA: MBL fold metallo-hydrolase [Candidatus Binatia bacterium]|nr:MBL fold metallo-hydrolase [Candidatus Binatia bacterium]